MACPKFVVVVKDAKKALGNLKKKINGTLEEGDDEGTFYFTFEDNNVLPDIELAVSGKYTIDGKKISIRTKVSTSPTAEAKKKFDRAAKDTEQLKKYCKKLKAVGVEDACLTESLDKFETALDTGVNIGEAADEAKIALKQHDKDLKSACKQMQDWVDKAECEHKVNGPWQWNALWIINRNNEDSVQSKSINKLLKEWQPSLMCDKWDFCPDEKPSAVCDAVTAMIKKILVSA